MKDTINKEADRLAKLSKKYLETMVSREYRIVDVKNSDKWTLINMILEAKYGMRNLKEFYYR